MKIIQWIAAAFVLFMFASSYGKEKVIPQISQLQTQRSVATLKIEVNYKRELEALKVEYTKKGDLKAANLIVDLGNGNQGSFLSGTTMTADMVDLESRRAAATAKVNTIFHAELDKLKLRFAKDGDLDSANEVTLLMMDVQSEMGLFCGEWIYTPPDGKQLPLTVYDDYTTVCEDRGSWKIVSEGKIRIVYNHSKNKWFECMAKKSGGAFVTSTSDGKLGEIQKRR